MDFRLRGRDGPRVNSGVCHTLAVWARPRHVLCAPVSRLDLSALSLLLLVHYTSRLFTPCRTVEQR